MPNSRLQAVNAVAYLSDRLAATGMHGVASNPINLTFVTAVELDEHYAAMSLGTLDFQLGSGGVLCPPCFHRIPAPQGASAETPAGEHFSVSVSQFVGC